MCAAPENMNCGMSVGRRCIKELRYADDTTLTAKSEEDMAELLKSSRGKCQDGSATKSHQD